MAKRQERGRLRQGSRRDRDRPVAEICSVCGGGILVEESLLPADRYPRRRVCGTCGAEYGTTTTTVINY